MVRSFKAYDNIDKKCDEVIFEHEAKEEVYKRRISR